MSKGLPSEQQLPLAMLMARNGFEVNPSQPLGRQSAGASFLEAYFRFSGNQLHRIIVPKKKEAKWFHQQAEHWIPGCRTQAVKIEHWGNISKASGCFYTPDPILDTWAWRRMPWGDAAFSLLGVVHTLCSEKVQRSLGQFSSAPIRNWDALICTSIAAQKAVTGFLERQEEWIKQRHGSSRFERPALPVIPLGIHPEDWEPKNQKEAKFRARKDLGIHANAEIVLIAGRLDLMTKTQPAPMLRALAELQQSEHPNLELLVYGEAPNPEMQKLWLKGAHQLAPLLKIHWVPGKESSLAAKVRWAADVFISLSDNPQETFGITPLEAMAAGIPCLVSDWDGYRDTVIQPNESESATGFRVPTRLKEGLGKEEAHGLLHNTIDYSLAVGQLAQGIAVDIKVFKESLSILLASSDLRLAMGEAGRRRVRTNYSWHVIIEQWRDLIQELNHRRKHYQFESATPPQLPPWLQDTSVSLGCFSSEIMPSNWLPPPPNQKLEQEVISNPFQSWDTDLLKHRSARRHGWWLKEGLVDL